MIKREYKIEQPFELTATPISWLDSMVESELSSIDDILLIASKPDYQIQDTHYISKSVSLAQIRDTLKQNLSIDLLQNDINELSLEINALSDISDNLSALTNGTVILTDVYSDEPISEPYILSSITFNAGNIISVDGYLLSDALSQLIPNQTYSVGNFQNLNCDKLMVNGSDVHALSTATKDTAGIIKAYSEDDIPTFDPYKINIRIGDDQFLYLSKNELKNAIINDLQTALSTAILDRIQETYYKTVVCESDPTHYDKNTVYFIAKSSIPIDDTDVESDEQVEPNELSEDDNINN